MSFDARKSTFSVTDKYRNLNVKLRGQCVKFSTVALSNFDGSDVRFSAVWVAIFNGIFRKNIPDFVSERLGSTPVKVSFVDTQDEAVLQLCALGIINGIGDGRFNPNGTLTRAEAAAIINRVARLFGIDTSGYTHSFTDVKAHWVDSELGWPTHVGIINGVGGSKFDPNGPLTNEQVVAIAYRAMTELKKNN